MIYRPGASLRSLIAMVACVALSVTLQSCSDGSDETVDEPIGDPNLTDEGYTAPGSTLNLGETATVPRTDGSAVIELTITAVDEADPAQLEGSEVEGDVPFHVRYEMKVVSGNAYGMTMSTYLSAWAEDKQVGSLIRAERFPPCQEVNFPLNSGPGTTITSCRTYLTEADAPPIDEVWFDNDDSHDDYDGGGNLTWDVPDISAK